MKIEGWRTFDRIIGKKHQFLSCLVNNAKHGAKSWGPGTFGPSSPNHFLPKVGRKLR